METPRAGLRLFVFYAALTLIPIVALGFLLAASIRSDLDHRGLAEGTTIARAVAHGAVEPHLEGGSLRDGPTGAERRALAEAFAPVLRSGDALQLRVRDAEGHVAFDPEQPDRAPFGEPDDEVVEALEGEPVRLLTRLNADEVDGAKELGPRAIEVYTPVRAGGTGPAVGALEIYVPYAPIAAAIDDIYARNLGYLVLGLGVLWSILALITWSVTGRVQRSAALTERLARTDNLTGLANRVALTETLREHLHGEEHAVTLLVADVDDFGQLNDALGQTNGDRFLQHVAEAVLAAAPDSVAVGRVGGDEFGVLLCACASDDVESVIERTRLALRDDFELDEVVVSADLTIGRVDAAPDTDATEVIRRATVACRTAKRGHLPMLEYSPDLERFDAGRLSLMSELRHGIPDDQLLLHYQPKIDLRTDRVVGVEALVRWEHPTRGYLPPGEFVPAAESTEIIIELTDWVIDRACAQAAAWQRAGRPIPIAVNVSARCLRDSSFADRVLGILLRHQVPTDLLSIEITETAVIADPARAAATLRRLADRGMAISIDDFGVGYTSLSHLEHLPVQELKIDRQFVAELAANPDHASVVRAIVSLGHGLGLKVVAEGVEDELTQSMLMTLGCDVGQGYGIARPAPIADIERWLDAQTAARTESAAVTPSA